MSIYAHFFKDVSKKCREILDDNRAYDIRLDREVTHMLALANAALGIPLERLDLSPLSGDKKKYPEAEKTLATLINSDYSSLFQRRAWCYGRWDGEPSEWQNKVTYESKLIEQYFENSDSLPKARVFLKHLRNSFAHGNLFFTPESGKIERIVFLQEDFTREKIDNSIKESCLNTGR